LTKRVEKSVGVTHLDTPLWDVTMSARGGDA
jgi:hypothetical protein